MASLPPSHVTPPEPDLAAEEDQELGSALDAAGYIPLRIAGTRKTTASDEPIDMSDMLLLAWTLMMCRFSGSQKMSIRCAWGCTQVPADGASTADIWVDGEGEGQLTEVLGTIRVLRRQASLSPGLLAEPEGNYMFINNGSGSQVTTGGRSDVCSSYCYSSVCWGLAVLKSSIVVVVSDRGSRVYHFGVRTYVVAQAVMAARCDGEAGSFGTPVFIPGYSQISIG